ncbi:MAG: 2-oxoglutarate dehydrogenase E1 component [Pseudomonadota bacterium]
MTKSAENDAFARTSFLYGGNAAFIEQLYAQYQDNPQAVDPEWREFFSDLADDPDAVKAEARGASWKRGDWPPAANGELVSALDGDWATLEQEMSGRVSKRAASNGLALSDEELRQATLDSVRALMMIRAYRMRGHLAADLDPLKLRKQEIQPELQPETYGFGPDDLDRPIFIDYVLGLETATIREIVVLLKRTYCSTLGVEFMHISDPAQKGWLQQRIEGPEKGVMLDADSKKGILRKLIESVGFENFLNVKYTGTKRFGLDGGEAILPALERVIKRGGQMGVKDVVIGMPHRGRLNVLANVMGKPYQAIFNEFKGGSFKPDEVEGSGDVKYHLGSSSDRVLDGNTIHLSLTANPSHLEIVDPVVLGKARAKQDQHILKAREDGEQEPERMCVLPLLLHGDAAFAGQGVVAECFGLSGLKGHKSGGSIHVIVNNQIGFTTSPIHSRSSPYPSDIAKMIEAPIFHVNGDDPEAVVYAAKVATEFRQLFGKPVVIDVFCYRRFGHNEGDEPAFTQPIMYQRIAKHPPVLELYSEKLIAEGVMTAASVQQMKEDFRAQLDEDFEAADAYKPNKADWLDGAWVGLKAVKEEGRARRGDTGVELAALKQLGKSLTEIPESFNAHKTLKRVIANRAKMMEGEVPVDWAMAEHLAFGTLLEEGFPVRLSGQDCERGTFSHRHSVLNDQVDESRYVPLSNLSAEQAHFEVINSMLSEEAVLAFEYGYSLAEPKALVIWEAQFGDFANGAQVVIDQFISSGERKWLRMSGLVQLLPHGFEGQGPEHSSARLERYLQLCAEDNMQVVNCTTPSNYFHVLRRQMHRDFRKPLVVMSPKSLLRHKRCVSPLAEFDEETSFHRVLWDDAEMLPEQEIKLRADEKIERVVLCTGKVYFDLYEEREKRGITDIYLMRLEQLYPFPYRALMKDLPRFPNAEVVWCQEEPKNMGSWTFVEPNIESVLGRLDIQAKRPRYIGRPPAASPATGLMSVHQKEVQAYLHEALSL